MKENKGITLLALIITIIVMLILASVVIRYGTKEIEKAKLEDLQATMLLIQGKSKIIIDKEGFGESYDNTGMIKLEEASNYDISLLQSVLSGIEDKSNLYIWEQTAMDNNNIDVTITPTQFYVIDYSTGEIYYSLGYSTDSGIYYSLTDIQNI